MRPEYKRTNLQYFYCIARRLILLSKWPSELVSVPKSANYCKQQLNCLSILFSLFRVLDVNTSPQNIQIDYSRYSALRSENRVFLNHQNGSIVGRCIDSDIWRVKANMTQLGVATWLCLSRNKVCRGRYRDRIL